MLTLYTFHGLSKFNDPSKQTLNSSAGGNLGFTVSFGSWSFHTKEQFSWQKGSASPSSINPHTNERARTVGYSDDSCWSPFCEVGQPEKGGLRLLMYLGGVLASSLDHERIKTKANAICYKCFFVFMKSSIQTINGVFCGM